MGNRSNVLQFGTEDRGEGGVITQKSSSTTRPFPLARLTGNGGGGGEKVHTGIKHEIGKRKKRWIWE